MRQRATDERMDGGLKRSAETLKNGFSNFSMDRVFTLALTPALSPTVTIQMAFGGAAG